MTDLRDGEKELGFDPANSAPDGHVVFIGRVRSPWIARADCPKNMAAARETKQPAYIELDAAYRDGLLGLGEYSHIALLTWLDRSRRNLLVQKPRHANSAKGVFAIRSPQRPNPIGLHVVRLLEIDKAAGVLKLEAIDVLDGTPIVDIKPYYAPSDAVSDAARPVSR